MCLVKDSFPVHADGVGDDSVATQQAIDKAKARNAATGDSRRGSGPFPFDNTLLDLDSGALVAHPEIAQLRAR